MIIPNGLCGEIVDWATAEVDGWPLPNPMVPEIDELKHIMKEALQFFFKMYLQHEISIEENLFQQPYYEVSWQIENALTSKIWSALALWKQHVKELWESIHGTGPGVGLNNRQMYAYSQFLSRVNRIRTNVSIKIQEWAETFFYHYR